MWRVRSTLLGLLCLLVLGPVGGAAQRLPQPPQIPETFPAKYRTWLTETWPLMLPQEVEVFLGLSKDYQRDAFIRRFWQVRDPYPETGRNEFQEFYEGNLDLARTRYDDLTEDRALMLLLNGAPADTLEVRCTELLYPLELWHYERTLQITSSFYLVFYKPRSSQPYQLWFPSDGLHPLLVPQPGLAPVDSQMLNQIGDQCARGGDVVSAVLSAVDWQRLGERVEVPPKPSEEWLRTFVAYSTDLPEGAEMFPAEVEITFPGRFQSRTLVQGVVSVPSAEVALAQLEQSSSYNFVLDGEVLLRDDLFEHFRYRFHLPASEAAATADGSLPLIFQRHLRPGAYTLVLKLEDLNGKRFYRERRELEVPFIDPAALAAAPPPVAESDTTAAPALSARLLSEANADLATGDTSIRLLAPFGQLLVGKVRVDADVRGPQVAKVRFLLNNRPVFAKTRPPYSVELNLGASPRTHVVRAEALDETGKQLAADEVLLNAGPHRFAVRLVEPQRGRRYSRSLRAQAVVEVPDGEQLDRLELYLNDTLIATLYQPPFVQPILIPPDLPLAYVRAAAFLKDGNSSEDVVFVNAPDYVDEIRIKFVELYTTVLDRRDRPVEDVQQDELQVLENDVEQKIQRLERVKDVPIHAGILLDVSNSMTYRLDEAVKAALRFFETVITPKDRAAVITFNETPHLAVRFTNDLGVLAGGLAGLTAEGETALYDSLVYALYYFSGISGKRAIILLSDGEDVRSHYTFDEVIQYAQHTGVTLYTIGVDLSSRSSEVRLKLQRLADETGGQFFFIDSASELGWVYEAIQQDLRSQYLITYQSTLEGDDFRRVEVKVSRPGYQAKTLRGYFP